MSDPAFPGYLRFDGYHSPQVWMSTTRLHLFAGAGLLMARCQFRKSTLTQAWFLNVHKCINFPKVSQSSTTITLVLALLWPKRARIALRLVYLFLSSSLSMHHYSETVLLLLAQVTSHEVFQIRNRNFITRSWCLSRSMDHGELIFLYDLT